MGDELDRMTAAQAMLLQPLLRMVSRHMPARDMLALRAELAAMRDEFASRGTPDAQDMAAACDLALADLLIDGPLGITTGPPSGPRH